jgi:hypothetical protein
VFAVASPGVAADERVARGDLGEVVAPSDRRSSRAQVRFTNRAAQDASAKVLRRAIRAVVTGDAPGDLSVLGDPATLDAIAASA